MLWFFAFLYDDVLIFPCPEVAQPPKISEQIHVSRETDDGNH